ncbi:TPA: GTP cyclohydrolase I FolE [Candidatus Poribacteria bacterium]|nr:GTP cyclohydrolase I FolE [Candidatus Poribacteria bacterium]
MSEKILNYTNIIDINPSALSLPQNSELDLDFRQDDSAIRESIRTILKSVGEDPDREGLKQTPRRVACMLRELLEGYWINPEELINGALFDDDYQEMVVVPGIEFYSLCEHHLLPFVGKAHVAYIPHKMIIGLSKIHRTVDMFARRLQIQERMTGQIADFLMEHLNPLGVAVVVDGVHMCAMIRGVKKATPRMVTKKMVGAFQDSEKTRAEFLAQVERVSGSIF